MPEIIKQLMLVEVLFSVDNGLHEEAYKLAAELIFDEYPDLRANEIQLIIKRAAMGDFGAVFNRIDVSVLMLWIKEYYGQRSEYHAIMRERDHDQRKHLGGDMSEVSEEMREKYKQIAEKYRVKSARDDEERLKRIAQAQLDGKRPDPSDMKLPTEEELKS